MPNTTWLTRAVGCVLFSPQVPSPAVTASIRGRSGDGGDLVSQPGEEPNARSQASFDRSESARWPSSQDPRRSRTAAQSMQTGDRPRAEASCRGDEATNCHLRDAAYHLELA